MNKGILDIIIEDDVIYSLDDVAEELGISPECTETLALMFSLQVKKIDGEGYIIK